MRHPKFRVPHRHVLTSCVGLALLGLVIVSLPLLETGTRKPLDWNLKPAYKEPVHKHTDQVLEGQCRPGRARRLLLAGLPASSHVTQPFLWKDVPLPNDLFLFPPPFGFRGLEGKAEQLLKQLPKSNNTLQPGTTSDECRRCVVVGNGAILRGLELGSRIDRFDTVIRLNSGPLGEFSVDVGSRTCIRMSYPEATPFHWLDTDPHTLFVAVVHKDVDISWTSAMINKHTVPLSDLPSFWRNVPNQVPLEPHRFRLLNPQVIRETALGLLKYPPPRWHLWGRAQNVPTMGASALNLASMLCDEVSLAGFGYNLSHPEAPVHYYESRPLSDMLQSTTHNVDRERELLQNLLREGIITDLTGGFDIT